MACEKDDNIKCKTEAKKLYKIFGQAFLIPCGKCGGYTNENPCYSCLEKRIQELEAEIQEVSNQLNDLYELCSETTRPAVYGTILGLHERLEQALKG